MKLLLTSSGISKRSTAEALTRLVGKKPGDTKIGFIPIAANVEPGNKDWYINQLSNLWRFGFSWIDIVDPSAQGVDWQERLKEVDVLFVSGGNTFHLLDQVRKTGFDKWLNENLATKVYVGSSAGTLLATPTIELANMPPGDSNEVGIKDLTGLSWVDFEVEPHCDQARFAQVEDYAKKSSHAVYAIDDQTAIRVVDDKVEVVSEGMWKLYE